MSHIIAEPKAFSLGPRRGKYYEINNVTKTTVPSDDKELSIFEKLDLVYRSLCAVLFNFVPTSGHPGGSISSGRFVESIIYKNMDYDFSKPTDDRNDMLVYAAGHKAMGLYAMYALRNEIVRAYRANLLPDEKNQMRLEDLLGFRRNPSNDTPLFRKFQSKALDGHPTPATPFVKVATGASGIGDPSSFGLAVGALDYFGDKAPKVNVVEGEGGMTPGRVAEALAAASAMRLYNVILHIDFNQASIDSNQVCREGDKKGDYVQWTPAELCYLHDFNVIYVDDGKDFNKILAAQQLAHSLDNKMPTAIVYRTIKGWKYGIEGKASHGGGHKFSSEGYYKALEEFENTFNVKVPVYQDKSPDEIKKDYASEIKDYNGDLKAVHIEKVFYDTLMTIRKVVESDKSFEDIAELVCQSQKRLFALNRTPRANTPKLENLYTDKSIDEKVIPEELGLKVGDSTTIRAVLGSSLGYLNKKTNGALLGVAADLLGSTSINLLGEQFHAGYFDAVDNPEARILSIGGICEDAIGAMMAGLAAFGKNIGASSSYGAFISAMEHTAARLHGIGEQNRVEVYGGDFRTWILINAHAGLKTGEDGPTHADPQCLQLLSGNFPKGIMITLTPWEPGEVWPLLIAGLKKHPAVLSPFVTRPNEKIADRKALNLAPVTDAVKGIYKLRAADTSKKIDGYIVLQESGVTIEFIGKVLPQLDKDGLNVEVYYVSSAELYDLLPEDEKLKIFPPEIGEKAMGITGFTLPTMYKWITGVKGRNNILYPFRGGKYLGSGNAESVLKQAGLDGDSMYKEVIKFIKG